MLNLRTALVALSIVAAAPAAAQDFTSMDLTSMYNGWMADQNEFMAGITNDIVSANVANPQVQAMYYQALQQGYAGSIEQFAYAYAENGGFTREGIDRNRQVTADINARNAKQNADYLNYDSGYAEAYGQYTSGFSNNINESGLGLTGQSTYNGPLGSQVLSHTWGEDTYHSQGGNNYYVDQSGQYWMADPNASGTWYGLN